MALVPLTDEEISGRLAELSGWSLEGDEISRMFKHTWHECVHLAANVAAKARSSGAATCVCATACA